MRGCAVPRRYKQDYNCDKFSVVNVYLDSVTFTAEYVSLCCVCGHVVVFGMYVMLSW